MIDRVFDAPDSKLMQFVGAFVVVSFGGLVLLCYSEPLFTNLDALRLVMLSTAVAAPPLFFFVAAIRFARRWIPMEGLRRDSVPGLVWAMAGGSSVVSLTAIGLAAPGHPLGAREILVASLSAGILNLLMAIASVGADVALRRKWRALWLVPILAFAACVAVVATTDRAMKRIQAPPANAEPQKVDAMPPG